ncbi:MAG: excinuclease ABC subunit UvrA [Planctomycetota bacterium]|nr:excinuclease ABC subunit UvrA [Planctomycetota bacterium]
MPPRTPAAARAMSPARSTRARPATMTEPKPTPKPKGANKPGPKAAGKGAAKRKAAPKKATKKKTKKTSKKATKKIAKKAVFKPASKAAGKRTPAAREQTPSRSFARAIRVRGAREHNLKDIDVDIPRDQLVVVTGLSGSGKSSLAFDTIFAEGQRKYMESLSAYARQFLDQLKKPDVDEIEGIPPTIAIEQRSASSNPRSTVATTTEIYDYLRLLYARCGTPYSWAPKKVKKDGTVVTRSGVPITATASSQIVDRVMQMGGGEGLGGIGVPSPGLQSGGAREERAKGRAKNAPTEIGGSETGTRAPRMMVLAPIVRGMKGFHKDVAEKLHRDGWVRARVNGSIVDLRDALTAGGENPLDLGRYEKHTIEAVVDRLVLDPESRQRLAESIEQGLRLGDGSVIVSIEAVPPTQSPSRERGNTPAWTDHAFSEKFADPEHPEYALEELSPRLFSFNSPFGACRTCHGLGNLLEFDEDLVIPDDSKSLAEGAVAAWAKNGPVRAWFNRKLRRFCKAQGVSFSLPVCDFTESQRQVLLYGEAGAKPGSSSRSRRRSSASKLFEGVIPSIMQWWGSTESPGIKEWLNGFMSQRPCPECHGDRLRIEALHVQMSSSHTADVGKAASETIIGRPRSDGTMLNVAELSRLTITDALAFIEGLTLSTEQERIAEPIMREVGNRLRFLTSVGLEYLSLDRRTATLSGGEAQRIRLATQVGSGLVGACYVLDEPTIGLHQRDNDRLIRTLRHLTDIGNTVIVVEHDEDMIRAADHVLDIGPGPGVHGGRVVAQGTVDELCAVPESITGDYLSGRRAIELPESRRKLSEKKAIVVKGARANNLKDVDVAFPIGGMVCVTGVSGSGKSTLVNDILLQALRRHLNGAKVIPGAHTKVNGLHHVDRVIEVDQSPIGRTPRSNPATYTGFFDDVRKIFTQTKESKIRGYKPGRFSFNVQAQKGGGRCEACQGQGLKKIEMHFLPDVFVECEICKGKRYNRETLEVTYRSKNIADVLAMTVEEAVDFFENHQKIVRFVRCLHAVGLGYITLGQPSTQLSGGEAQRIKLATELGKGVRADGTGTGERTLYVLDEPTTGLHFEDIRKLLGVLDQLADAGNTLVVIEHNLDVIKCADWIIDLGPEGGDRGGRIVATGTPEQVAKVTGSSTGAYLKRMLG